MLPVAAWGTTQTVLVIIAVIIAILLIVLMATRKAGPEDAESAEAPASTEPPQAEASDDEAGQ